MSVLFVAVKQICLEMPSHFLEYFRTYLDAFISNIFVLEMGEALGPINCTPSTDPLIMLIQEFLNR